jgi:hypothetical protein
MSRPDWTSRSVEIDGEQFSVEYLIEDQMISVRVLSPAGCSPGITSYYKGVLESQLEELTRELVGRE